MRSSEPSGTAWCKAMSRIVCTELAMYKFISNCLHLPHRPFLNITLIRILCQVWRVHSFCFIIPLKICLIISFVSSSHSLMSSALITLLSLALPLLRRSMASCNFLWTLESLSCSLLQLCCFPRYLSILRLLCSFTLPFHHRRRSTFCRILQRHLQFLFVMSQLHHSRCLSLEWGFFFLLSWCWQCFFVPFISSRNLAIVCCFFFFAFLCFWCIFKHLAHIPNAIHVFFFYCSSFFDKDQYFFNFLVNIGLPACWIFFLICYCCCHSNFLIDFLDSCRRVRLILFPFTSCCCCRVLNASFTFDRGNLVIPCWRSCVVFIVSFTCSCCIALDVRVPCCHLLCRPCMIFYIYFTCRCCIASGTNVPCRLCCRPCLIFSIFFFCRCCIALSTSVHRCCRCCHSFTDSFIFLSCRCCCLLRVRPFFVIFISWLLPGINVVSQLAGQSTGRIGKRRARWRRDTRKGTKWRTEREQTINQPHIMDDHGYGVMNTNTFMSHDVIVHH